MGSLPRRLQHLVSWNYLLVESVPQPLFPKMISPFTLKLTSLNRTNVPNVLERNENNILDFLAPFFETNLLVSIPVTLGGKTHW